jgi:hypothetical protein
MKLIRPHVPLNIRCEVAARQLQQREGGLKHVLIADLVQCETYGERLAYMLACLFGEEPVHLDHDPALCLREIIDADKGIYKPDANDPRYLVYRTAEDHRLKTFVKGDGAQLSDAGKRRKDIRRKRKAAGERNWVIDRSRAKTGARAIPTRV